MGTIVVNWGLIVGVGVLLLAMLGGVVLVAVWLFSGGGGGGHTAAKVRPVANKTVTVTAVAEDPGPVARGPDDLPPDGAKEWVVEMCAEMEAAKPDTILECLKMGATKSQAGRIAELSKGLLK